MVVHTGDEQPSAAGEAHLWVCSGQNIGRRFALDKPDMVIGRSGSADIPVIDERVSQQHAIIETAPNGHRLRDLGSTNGTFVNNQRVQNAALKDGDLLQVGETVFEYLSYQERNLTITVRGNTNHSEGVPAALRNEARQMLEQARVTPGGESEPLVVPAMPRNPTVDVPLTMPDPAFVGGGQAYVGTQVPAIQRPARDVNPYPYPPSNMPVPYMAPMPNPYGMHPGQGTLPAPGGLVGTMEERRGEVAVAESDEEDDAGMEAILIKLRDGRDAFLPYWKSVTLLLLLGIAGGFAYFRVTPPMRVAEFEIALEVSTQNNPFNQYRGRLNGFFVGAELAFKTPDLIEKTLIELGRDNPSAAVLNRIKKKLELVSVGPPTPNTYTGKYKNTDPDFTLQFLDTHVKLYLEAEVEKALKVLKVESVFLEEQVEEIAKKLRRSEAEIVEFKKKNLEGGPERASQVYGRLISLRLDESKEVMNLQKASRTRQMLQRRLRMEQPLVKTKARFENHYKRALAEIQLDLVKERSGGKGPDHPDIVRLERRLRELQVKSDAASDDPTSYETARNPIHTQIQNEERNLQVQEQLAQQQLAYYRSEIAKTEILVANLPELEAERSDLMRNYETDNAQYKKMLAQLQVVQIQLSLERASTAARYTIISAPHLVYLDKNKKAMVFGGLGGFMGGAMGVLLTLARVFLKQRKEGQDQPDEEVIIAASDSTALAQTDPGGPLAPRGHL